MKLHYRKMGEGPPVIILHGLFGMGDNWLTIGRRIAERHTVYLLDQRNHGHSPHSADFTYEVLSNDLAEFIKDHALAEVILIGHSMGGKTAMLFALQKPQKLSKLVVVDIAPKAYNQPYFKLFVNALSAIPLQRLTSRQEVEAQLKKVISQRAIRRFLLKNLARNRDNRFYWKINLSAIAANLHEIMKPVDGAQPFAGPALFVRGETSDYILDEDIPEIKRLFPNSRLVTIAQASHWLHAETPDNFCRHLKEFFSENKTDK